jgi:hypothetical protein
MYIDSIHLKNAEHSWRGGGKYGEILYVRCPDQNFDRVLVPSEHKSEALLP